MSVSRDYEETNVKSEQSLAKTFGKKTRQLRGQSHKARKRMFWSTKKCFVVLINFVKRRKNTGHNLTSTMTWIKNPREMLLGTLVLWLILHPRLQHVIITRLRLHPWRASAASYSHRWTQYIRDCLGWTHGRRAPPFQRPIGSQQRQPGEDPLTDLGQNKGPKI